MALHLLSPTHSAAVKVRPLKRLDNELMDLVILRNQGVRLVRRTISSAPEAIEDVMADIRMELARAKRAL